MKPELSHEQRGEIADLVIKHLRLNNRVWRLDNEVEPPPLAQGLVLKEKQTRNADQRAAYQVAFSSFAGLDLQPASVLALLAGPHKKGAARRVFVLGWYKQHASAPQMTT